MGLNLNKLFPAQIDINCLGALWLLKMIDVNEIQNIASKLVGRESSNFGDEIISILICSNDDYDNLRMYFDKFIRENSSCFKSKESALIDIAKHVSNTIINDSISALDGASFLWSAIIKSEVANFHDLDAFIYAASEAIDRPEDKDFFESAIRTEALRWSERPLSR